MSRIITVPAASRVAAIGGVVLGNSLSIVQRRSLGGGPTPAPTPTVFLSAAISQNEGDSGTTIYTFTVTRSDATGAVSVPWSFAAGTTSADDFVGGSYPAGGTVDMADGVATVTFQISVQGDTTVESDEDFTVSIAAPSGYALGTPSSATGTILNDDVAGAAAMPDGYDVIAFYGDSLVNGVSFANNGGVGYTRDPSDVDKAGAYALTGHDAAGYGVTSNVITSDITPVLGANNTTTDRLTLAEYMARSYVDALAAQGVTNRRVLVVVGGRSGATIYVGSPYLAPGELYYVDSTPYFSSAISQAKAAFPGSRYRGLVLALGTNDANAAGNLVEADIETAMNNIASSLRSDIEELDRAAVLFFGPSPTTPGVDPDKDTLRTAQANVAAALPNGAVIDVTGTTWPDNTHAGRDALVTIGDRAASQLLGMAESDHLFPFSVGSVTGAAPDTDIDSAPFMVRIGYGITATLSIADGETAIAPVSDPTNFGSFSATDKTLRWGDMVKVRRHSSVTAGANVSATATITGPSNTQTSTFSVTTAARGTDFVTPAGWGAQDFAIVNDNGLSRFGGTDLIQGTY